MSNYGYPQQVTPLENLPDLEELEMKNPNYGQGQMMYGHQPQMYGQQHEHPSEEKFRKFIRGNQQLMPESGMAPNVNQQQSQSQLQSSPPQIQRYSQPPPQMSSQPSCLDIASHVHDCPICSRFYHCDRTIYIVIIAIISMICLLLLKKILNV